MVAKEGRSDAGPCRSGRVLPPEVPADTCCPGIPLEASGGVALFQGGQLKDGRQ